ncbi:protein amalgam [Nilaparvata lugens]|uniref:protein amalgam n=1 Tax=Nilaparvata lugens TaxID=108931 RepID=UPI000B97F60C|nr:protein amalgam [Nilaparvata lugens]
MALKSGWIVILVAVHLFVYQGNGAKSPTFSTPSSTIQAVVGDTVLLPCKVVDLGNYLVAWKRGIAVLTAGTVKVSPDERLFLLDNYNLQLRAVQESDAGDYACQIATIQPIEITHTLQILVPPHIEGFSPEGVLEVEKGSRMQVDCVAGGHPEPSISWSKNGRKMSSDARLELHNAQKQDAGMYLCTANNGVGIPASAQLELNVLYAPDVNVSSNWIHAGDGSSANLSCIVESYPTAIVTWYRETKPLTPTERSETRSTGHQYWLMLHHVRSSDFGLYTCVAENRMGKAKGTIELSGKPHRVVFTSQPESRFKDRYTIAWTVHSLSPVEEFKLLYRRSSRSLSSPHSTARYFRRFDGSNNTVAGDMTVDNWSEVALRASMSWERDAKQETSFELKGLEPSATYEALVQARNKFGWSQISDTFHFVTRAYDPLEPSEPNFHSEPEVRGIGVRALSSTSSKLVLVSAGLPLITLLSFTGVFYGT